MTRFEQPCDLAIGVVLRFRHRPQGRLCRTGFRTTAPNSKYPLALGYDVNHVNPFLNLADMYSGLGPPVVPSYPFLGENSPTKIDYRKKQ